MTSPYPFIPVHALEPIDIKSILSIALASVDDPANKRRYDHHHSRRTMLYYLLTMKDADKDGKLLNMMNASGMKIDWPRIEQEFKNLQKEIEPYQLQYRVEEGGRYWELNLTNYRQGASQARQYIQKSRPDGFQPNELKLYWNYEQIRQITEEDRFDPIKDQDSHQNLRKYPVKTRNNSGKVAFKRAGIEQAVFHVPAGKQVIVLDFADERMPGGYFLENARTQEEVILFNSDGYQALLDLKYTMMKGGYMLPEYGLAYIKNVRFYRSDKGKLENRSTDLIVAACYDLSPAREGIYIPPPASKKEEIRERTYRKFQAIVASAVANTEGDGKNTYLLLGPIGTGAFSNDIRMIAGLFSEILNSSLMGSDQPIRTAFDEIWFVSIDSLEEFKQAFEKNSS